VDYIVFGTGYGATLLVLGWAVRTFGPKARFRDADQDSPARADVLVYRAAWRRFAEALGAVMATAGAGVIVLTFLTALINPGDHAGAVILRVCFALVLIGTAVWLWLYVARFGVDGIIPERLDIGRLFAPRERPFTRSSQRPEPAPAISATPDYRDSDVDPQFAFDEPYPLDDMYGDELEIDEEEDAEMAVRYSRYQVHHPDENRDDAYRDLFEMHGSESDVAIGDDMDDTFDDEPDAPGIVDADAIEESDDTAPYPADEPQDLVGEAAAEADVFPDDEESVEVPELDAQDETPDFGEDSPLPDTPEGRAEALRRIQAWQPEDDA